MTVKAITRLNWSWFIWFSHWLVEMVSNTILPIRRSSVLLFTGNQVDRGSKSSVQLVCVMPPRFQSNQCDWF